ncbi:hypothetical protein MTP03_22290 [Tsukamurella sp. PLM1]|nr:hypothetical protein MTP03_22290 [Tsukamurella sp. PLM1]
MILCVTGTSTGVGKTVATAALAAALLPSGPVTVVKPAQTGLADGAERDADGQLADAAEVERLAPGTRTVEHLRFPDPLAPLTAARRAGREPQGAPRPRPPSAGTTVPFWSRVRAGSSCGWAWTPLEHRSR